MIHTIAQLLGYIASLLLAISLLVHNDIKFRWLNGFGGVSFILYGLLINEWPIIITNGILVSINFFYLYKLYKTDENFDLMEFKKEFQIVSKFFNFYSKDISSYFPTFINDGEDKNLQFLVLRDMVIANVFIAQLQDNGTATVELNYTVPKYRDFKIGTFLFKKEKNYLITKGVKKIVYKHVSNKQHEKFLLRTGFVKDTNSEVNSYSLEL